MNTYKILKLMMILIISVSLSCEKDQTNGHLDIDSDIIITMSQDLSDPGILVLSLKTEKSYGCSNYRIIANSRASMNKIEVDILGISVPQLCATALGPARTKIELRVLQNIDYEIEFRIGDTRFTGTLAITTDEYKLTMHDTAGIKIDGAVLKKIPENLIWGTIGYIIPETIDTVNNFLEQLKIIGASEIVLENGDYFYFEIKDHEIQEPENSGYWYTEPFVYTFSGDKAPVRSLVKEYSEKYGDRVFISVYGARGEKFLGWILVNE